MSKSTEFKERRDDYADERQENIYLDFTNTLKEKDPDLARELNAADHLPRENLSLPWGYRNEQAQLKAQTIFQTFQESAGDYLESITRMNEIQKRIAGASG